MRRYISVIDRLMWTCAEETKWIHWTKDVKYRAARLKKKRKRPQTRLMEVMKDDMKMVGVTEEIGRQIHCGDL